MGPDGRPRHPLSITELGNIVSEMTAKTDSQLREESLQGEHVINTPPRNRESTKYLMDAIKFMPDNEYRKLLILRINGYSIHQIARYLNQSVEFMKQKERDAIRFAKDAIDKRPLIWLPGVGVTA